MVPYVFLYYIFDSDFGSRKNRADKTEAPGEEDNDTIWSYLLQLLIGLNSSSLHSK